MNLLDNISNDDHSSRRKPLVTDLGEETELSVLQQWQEQALEPVKEDVIEWLNITLGCSIQPEGFLQALDDGIILCHLIQLIQRNAVECTTEGKEFQDIKMKCKENAQSGTWFARDNIANFLKWCKACGVKEECMFETEGLVSHRNEREVILCLLELVRIAMQYGIKPSGLVALEREIDRKHNRINVSQMNTDSACGDNCAESQKEYCDSEHYMGIREKRTLLTEPGRQRTHTTLSKVDQLDSQVKNITMNCTCKEQFQVDRISEGNYVIGGKNMFVRLLKGCHLMVRVGGGWDTLKHYISTHDPCRILQFKRDGTPTKSKLGGEFLHVKGKYKKFSQK